MANYINNDGDDGRRLRLVVNNDPEYKLKSTRQRILEQKKREHEETMELIRTSYTQRLETLRIKAYHKIGAVAALIIAGAAGAYVSCYNWNDAPTEIIPLGKDLNGDNVSDSYILQKGGHKIPMYGLKLSDGTIVYKTAEHMEKSQNNIINYANIEDRLNE
ncbi:MAG: hypothetical protein AABX24_03395 [Nanoarchaeota archaeon]